MAALPYLAEYAKSGQSGCNGCGSKINQSTLRIAAMLQNQFADNKKPYWYHADCIFMYQGPTTTADISKFITLKYDDQVRIKKAIDKNNKQVKVKLSTKKRASDKENIAIIATLKNFRVEYSNNNSICRRCIDKICMGQVRICKDAEDISKYGGQPLCYHVKCFKEERSALHYFAGGMCLPGFYTLNNDDQAMVKKEISPLESDDVPMKKLKAGHREAFEQAEDETKEKEMKQQNELFYKHRDALSIFKKRDITELLVENFQAVPAGLDECLDLLADIMAFGALVPCTECAGGKFVLDTFGYKCTGYITAYAKCSCETQDPRREPMIIPDSYRNMDPFEGYKPETAVRLFPVKTSAENPSKDLPILPLKNLQFLLYGNLEDREDTERRIIKLGGLVVPELMDTTVAVVSTKEGVERMPEKMQEIQAKDIQVVEASYLDNIDPKSGTIDNSLQLIKYHNIAPWGSDPSLRLTQDVLSGKSFPKSGSMDLSASSIKLKIKGGSAVDPDSKLEDVAHVYKDSEGSKYTVALCQTDVVAQTNKYYKMQVLETDDKERYYVFLSWGKTGTEIGRNQLKDFKSAEDAVDFFQLKYNQKTGNDWIDRDAFQKVPGLYNQLDIVYDEEEATTPEVDRECELAMPVQKLTATIFDTDIMRETMLEFQLDTKKMPLGMLSKKQIENGQEVLSELHNCIESGSVSQNEIVDATNRFFTLIPHDLGKQNAPLLDNLELIKEKAEMLDNLREIEIAYSLMKTNFDKTIRPIEFYFTKLKAEIAPLDKNSDEFQLLQEYTRNTHAVLHSDFSLEIEEVFKVVRHDEDERYQQFRRLHNRRLLWHGSRVNNYAGILSQGLRIAPPEAPMTGYMFGKGIYFADMVSKSANYCRTNKHNTTGLMLLCEVALGNMKKCYGAEKVKLPADKHSAWGVGRTEPDPAGNKTLDCGTIVPMGKPYDKQVSTSLLYNEFIVYDPAQVNVKYLLQMKFNYTY